MAINENKLRDIISESLGIAAKVITMTNEIEDNIISLYDSSDNNTNINETFYVGDLRVFFRHYYVDNDYELNDYEYVNGYSYSNNTLYLTYSSVKGEDLNLEYLIDTIQHEVEHYWQCKNAKKDFHTSKYQAIVDGRDSRNIFLSNICLLFYFNNRFELDAWVNGSYNLLRKLNLKTYKEYIEQTELKTLFETLENIEKSIKTINEKSQNFLMAKNYIKKYNIFKKEFSKENLLLLLNRIEDYLYKKIGKAWIYYVKEGKRDLTNEEIEKLSLPEKRLYYAAKHNEKMMLEGKKNDIIY